MYRLEDINENVTSLYGNPIKLTQKGIGNCKNMRNLLLCPNGLTDLHGIWNQDILVDDASLE